MSIGVRRRHGDEENYILFHDAYRVRNYRISAEIWEFIKYSSAAGGKNIVKLDVLGKAEGPLPAVLIRKNFKTRSGI